MTTAWTEFLAHHARRASEPDLERAAALQGAIIAPLDDGLIRFGGADAMRLLQGQLTSDVQNLPEQHSVLAGFASPQGRLRAIVRIYRFEEAYFLQLPAELLEPVLAEFKKYAPLYRQLQLSDVSGEYARLALSGQTAADSLQARFGALPASPDSGLISDALLLSRLPGNKPRFTLLGKTDALLALWPALSTELCATDGAVWELTEIAAGLPQIYAQTANALLPLNINLQLVGGVNWKKGCYTGQEIIARMHYRSTLKRHGYIATVAATQAPAPGTPLFDGTEAVGTVLRAAQGPQGRVHLFVELPVTARSHATVRLADELGPILEFGELPYALVASYQSGAS